MFSPAFVKWSFASSLVWRFRGQEAPYHKNGLVLICRFKPIVYSTRVPMIEFSKCLKEIACLGRLHETIKII